MRGKILKVILVLLIIVILVYAGACIYGNLKPDNQQPKITFPESNAARYEIIVRNTGTILLSNDARRIGTVIKLTGFWELSGNKFVFRDRQYILDEKVYGPVDINLRKEATK